MCVCVCVCVCVCKEDETVLVVQHTPKGVSSIRSCISNIT